LVAATLILLALGGCAGERTQVEKKEDLLLISGFVARPADTKARQTMLATLTPHTFIRRPKGDQFIYIYSDPTVCNCLYIGNEKALGAYEETIYDRRLARDGQADTQNLRTQEFRDEQLKVQLVEDQSWDWGPWGPAFW